MQSSVPISPRNGKLMILFESNSRIGPSADDMIDITIDTAVDIFDATSIGKLEANNFIQLLPNKEPYVSIEEAPSNARRIFTGVDIMADMESIWEVLTAFEKLQDVVPSLVQNEVQFHFLLPTPTLSSIYSCSTIFLMSHCYLQVVFRTAEGGARLAQVGGAKVLPGVTFTAKTVLDVNVYKEVINVPFFCFQIHFTLKYH